MTDTSNQPPPPADGLGAHITLTADAEVTPAPDREPDRQPDEHPQHSDNQGEQP